MYSVDGIVLEPCPFCDSDNVRLVKGSSDFLGERMFVECGDCSARGPIEYFPEKAANAWNERHC